jgi:hypothetical protein
MEYKRCLLRLTTLVVLAAFPFSSLAGEYLSWQAEKPDSSEAVRGDCAASLTKGQQDASARHSSTGWMLGGLGSGILLGLIGTAITTGIAATSDPYPNPLMIPGAIDTTCYMMGYHNKGKSKNTWSAFGGGLLGTGIFVMGYLIYTSASD